MDNQTKQPNDFGAGDDPNQDRPLSSFLQAQQNVRVLEPEDEEGLAEAESTGDYLSDDDDIIDGDGGEREPGDQGAKDAAPELDPNKLNIALKALKQMEQQISTVIGLLETGSTVSTQEAMKTFDVASPLAGMASADGREDLATLKPIDGRVVEGVFDGRGMVGSDGKSYLVPPNYASKSKLVEGDMLKLTITPKGSFIYKQIGPIERSRLIGTLGFDQTIGEFYATSDNRRWNVLKASVTYFKGDPSDEVVLLVPKNAPSKWAAVENIIKKNPLG